jgi:hypothetical protein
VPIGQTVLFAGNEAQVASWTGYFAAVRRIPGPRMKLSQQQN